MKDDPKSVFVCDSDGKAVDIKSVPGLQMFLEGLKMEVALNKAGYTVSMDGCNIEKRTWTFRDDSPGKGEDA